MQNAASTPKIGFDPPDAYLRVALRYLDALEDRAAALDTDPALDQLAVIVPIRLASVAIATARSELSILRRVFLGMRSDWPAEIQRPWFPRKITDELFDLLVDVLRPSAREVQDSFPGISVLDPAALARFPDSQSYISSVFRKRDDGTLRIHRKSTETLTALDLGRLDGELSRADPSCAFQPGRRLSGEPLAAALRILMQGLWRTGMRPVEIASCRIWMPSLAVPDPALRQAIETDPLATLDGIRMQEVLSAWPGAGFTTGADLARFASTTGVPLLLSYDPAKTTNRNERVPSRPRVLILDAASPDDLAWLTLLARLARSDLFAARAETTLRTATRVLARLAIKADLRDRGGHAKHVNLYSFRHAFVTRLKRSFDTAESAALTGHTSRKTLYRYGEFVGRAKRSRGQGLDWLPRPDPAQVAALRAAWAEPEPEAPELSTGKTL
jgi:hypothetical protein